MDLFAGEEAGSEVCGDGGGGLRLGLGSGEEEEEGEVEEAEGHGGCGYEVVDCLRYRYDCL